MADGTMKPIDQIVVGDLVMASDPETDLQGARPVVEVFVHDDSVVDLELEGETLATTEDHPFWSVSASAFVRADQLSAGDPVLGADGDPIRVVGLAERAGGMVPAYNFAVAGIHTYHVGASAALVHNRCGEPNPADFMVGPDGTTVPLSASRMTEAFDRAGLDRFTTDSAGAGYIFPDGSRVRVMEPNANDGLRAIFANSNGQPINRFTGKPNQPPRGTPPGFVKGLIRDLNHFLLRR